MSKNLIYDIHDRPRTSQLIIFSLQQLLAIMAATIAVPAQVGYGMSASAALFGAGAGSMIPLYVDDWRTMDSGQPNQRAVQVNGTVAGGLTSGDANLANWALQRHDNIWSLARTGMVIILR